MAPGRGSGLFQLPRDPGQRREAGPVPERRDAKVATPATATEPTAPLDLGTLPVSLRYPAPGGLRPAPVPHGALRRQASEVRTVCVSSASTGPCGGRRAIVVPTATTDPPQRQRHVHSLPSPAPERLSWEGALRRRRPRLLPSQQKDTGLGDLAEAASLGVHSDARQLAEPDRNLVRHSDAQGGAARHLQVAPGTRRAAHEFHPSL